MTDQSDSDQRRGVSRRGFLKGGAAVGVGLAAAAETGLSPRPASAQSNPIVTENALPGTTDDWQVYRARPQDAEGFATPYSVNAGERVEFKIQTQATDFELRIYRIGWYGGAGARRVAIVNPSVSLPVTQPDYYEDFDTGLIDCSNWTTLAHWDVPASAVSGVYVATIDVGNGPIYQMLFVVRNDGRASDVLVQTSDTTYQAYNFWGRSSLYFGYALSRRATKVGYNRPYNPSEIENDFFYGEAPLVRWLERNGYDVAYCGNVDTAARPAELLSRKVFVSSGHDEYWSGSMRSNVEAARDAGVNLIFMTGNEVFWRIRFEPSPISGQSHQTIVCYKETLEGAKVDPSNEWTGTWRDARFTPPAIGGANPENALTGTLFKAINPVGDPDFAIKVPSTYSALRFWRNTDIANLTPGSTATLTDYSLGYEWNTDPDNGFRPKGLIRLSETTEVAKEVLQDEGATYIQAPLTHYMTLYRADSGALVWSTGTVQWSWGLDDDHENRPSVAIPTDVRMQQATVNVLADMGVQPATRQANLVAASPSTDTVAPTSTIQSPANGASGPVGTPVIVSGTASDTGGGVVAGVEVSVDGGTTWHAATGTTSWSYTFVPDALGPTTILSRATDDSCNTESPGPGRSFEATTRPLPASIWPESTVPAQASVSDTSPVEVGVRFQSYLSGYVTGIRFYKGPLNGGQHTGALWTNTGQLLGTVEFTGETGSGWQTARFTNPIEISSDVTYVASYTAPQGGYALDAGGLSSGFELAPLRALPAGEDGPNGVFGNPGTFPSSSFGSANYWVDIEFDIDNNAPPAVAERSPAADVSAVATSGIVTVTFTEAIQAGTAQIVLTGPGGPVSGSTSYDSGTRTATFTPDAPLAGLTTYTATVSGGIDQTGDPMSPVTWSFTTTGAPGETPATLWTSDDVPANQSFSDPTAIEVGLRFTCDIDAEATAIRFYQGIGNTGPHVGRLWDLEGNVLGTATFTYEAGIGWREAPLDSRVPLVKDTTYVVSYYAPNGRYASSPSNLSTARTRDPLTAPASSEVGGNGVYTYGTGGGFPSSTYNATNYWVDVVVESAPDETAPIVANTVPAPDIVAVGPAQPIVVGFDGAVEPSSVTFTLTTGGSPVSGSVTFPNPATAVLTPSAPLANGTSYTASIIATDVAGNAMAAPYTWSFVTATGAGSTPATIWTTAVTPDIESANDTTGVEAGVKFTSSVAGSITAIRYYRGPGNVGPHVGKLWAADGTLLGSASFDNESAVGWQQADFATPIPIEAGVLYVASYFAPSGGYAITTGGLSAAAERSPLQAPSSGASNGNGVYRYGSSGYPNQSFSASNYFVDVVFVDDGGPSVTTTTPAAGATAVTTDVTIEVEFSEPVDVGTVTVELRDGGGGLVPQATAQNGPSGITVTPASALAQEAAYTVTVVQASDAQGNAMSGPYTWSFTTAGAPVWNLFGTAVPSVPAANDPSTGELGMKFQVTEAVEAIALRFYRGPGNAGPHVGHLWLADGTQLAEVTFATGGPDGWQEATLAAPVSLSPGQTYVVSYYTPSGFYSVDLRYFRNRDVTSGPIVGLNSNTNGGNGVYVYGGGFPTNSYQASNYWVDVQVRSGGNP